MGFARRLADAQHLIIVEVALLNLAVLEGDFALQGHAHTHDRGALHLRADSIRIDRRTAVDGEVEPRNGDVAFVVHCCFDNDCGIAQVVTEHSQAEAVTGRQFAAPSRLVRDELHHIAKTPGVDRIHLRILGVVPEVRRRARDVHDARRADEV